MLFIFSFCLPFPSYGKSGQFSGLIITHFTIKISTLEILVVRVLFYFSGSLEWAPYNDFNKSAKIPNLLRIFCG